MGQTQSIAVTKQNALCSVRRKWWQGGALAGARSDSASSVDNLLPSINIALLTHPIFSVNPTQISNGQRDL